MYVAISYRLGEVQVSVWSQLKQVIHFVMLHLYITSYTVQKTQKSLNK